MGNEVVEVEPEEKSLQNAIEKSVLDNETKDLLKDPESIKPMLKRKIEETSPQSTHMVDNELETFSSKRRRNEILVEENQGAKKPRLMEKEIKNKIDPNISVQDETP